MSRRDSAWEGLNPNTSGSVSFGLSTVGQRRTKFGVSATRRGMPRATSSSTKYSIEHSRPATRFCQNSSTLVAAGNLPAIPTTLSAADLRLWLNQELVIAAANAPGLTVGLSGPTACTVCLARKMPLRWVDAQPSKEEGRVVVCQQRPTVATQGVEHRFAHGMRTPCTMKRNH